MRRPAAAAASAGRRGQRQGVQADVGRGDRGRGGAPEAARVGGLGVAAGLDRLERDRREAAPAGEAQQAGGDQRLADARVRAGDEQAARRGSREDLGRGPRRGVARSAGSWAADRVIRRRDEPGRDGRRPDGGDEEAARAFSAAATAKARVSLPSTTGTIGPIGRPATSAAAERAPRPGRAGGRRAGRGDGPPRARQSARGAASAAAATGGGSAVVKMKVRARFTSRSRSARPPARESAGGADGLAQGPDQDVRHDARGGAETASARAEDAEGVGLVHDEDAVGGGGGLGEGGREGRRRRPC